MILKRNLLRILRNIDVVKYLKMEMADFYSDFHVTFIPGFILRPGH
jgi:hypothetical protein